MSFRVVKAADYPKLAEPPNKTEDGLILIPMRFTFSTKANSAKYRAYLHICSECQTIHPWCKEATKRNLPCPTCGVKNAKRTTYFFLYQTPQELKVKAILATSSAEAYAAYSSLPEILPEPLLVFEGKPLSIDIGSDDYEPRIFKRHKGDLLAPEAVLKPASPPAVQTSPYEAKANVAYTKPRPIPIQDLMRMSK